MCYHSKVYAVLGIELRASCRLNLYSANCVFIFSLKHFKNFHLCQDSLVCLAWLLRPCTMYPYAPGNPYDYAYTLSPEDWH